VTSRYWLSVFVLVSQLHKNFEERITLKPCPHASFPPIISAALNPQLLRHSRCTSPTARERHTTRLLSRLVNLPPHQIIQSPTRSPNGIISRVHAVNIVTPASGTQYMVLRRRRRHSTATLTRGSCKPKYRHTGAKACLLHHRRTNRQKPQTMDLPIS
jgi:hypothetical protein